MSEILPASDPKALESALAALRAGALIVIPTDTVYGIAANPWKPEALRRIYAVKGRNSTKAIPLLVGLSAHLAQVSSEVPPCASALIKAYWPGPLTVIVPKAARLPTEISPFPTVGVRMPANDFALKLLKAAGPLAVTSANISGKPPALSAAEAAEYLGNAVALIVDGGPAAGGTASTVVDCTASPPRILRPGPITETQIRQVLKNAPNPLNAQI